MSDTEAQVASAPSMKPTPARQIAGARTHGLINAIDFGFFPRSFSARNVRRYGTLFRSRSVEGDLIFTAEPDQVKRIFAGDFETFTRSDAFSLAPFFGDTAVILSVGAQHKRQRKLLSPPLSGQRLRALGTAMQEVAEQHVATLQPGQELRALELTTRFTLDVIIRTVFGLVSERERTVAQTRLRALTDNVTVLPIFLPRLQRSWYPPWARYLKAREQCRGWLLGLIAERRKAGGARPDVLSLLLEARYDDGSAMGDGEIYDQLITLLLAGFETTAITLANTLDNLLHRPAVLERVLRELPESDGSAEGFQRLPYLGAVIDETLRIQPIITDLIRVPRADFELAPGLVLAKGQPIIVLIEALHFDERIYPEPHSYRPERFLGRKFQAHEFAPFGGGVRRCLGAAFSDYESRIFLGTLLNRVKLNAIRAKIDPRVRRNLTMAPKYGVPVHVVGRR